MMDKCQCGGELEATSTVYLTCELQDGDIVGLDFASVNDLLDGHPIALETELRVECSDCGEEIDFNFPMDSPIYKRITSQEEANG